MAVQSPGARKLLSLKVRVGDEVKKGEVIAVIEQPELQKQLQQARTKLEQLRNQNRNAQHSATAAD